MTLVLSELSRRWVLQVADRLVSRGGKPFDALANKSIIFLGRDGIVSIGYTGLAYLGEPPITTDRWIAHHLAVDIPPDDGEGALKIIGDAPRRWPDVGKALLTLRAELTAEFQRRKSIDRPSLQLVAAGWQWKATGWQWNMARSRPVLCWVENLRTSHKFEAVRLPRNWGWEQSRLHLSATPRSNVPDAMGKEVASDLSRTKRAEDSERRLAECIQDIARTNLTVGPHCMCTTIHHPMRNRVVVARYKPSVDAVGAGPSAYTPWVVTPAVVVAPTMFTERMEVSAGPYTFLFEGPDEPIILPDGSTVLFQRQPRPEPNSS